MHVCINEGLIGDSKPDFNFALLPLNSPTSSFTAAVKVALQQTSLSSHHVFIFTQGDTQEQWPPSKVQVIELRSVSSINTKQQVL